LKQEWSASVLKSGGKGRLGRGSPCLKENITKISLKSVCTHKQVFGSFIILDPHSKTTSDMCSPVFKKSILKLMECFQ
jgi:hypothetical protein